MIVMRPVIIRIGELHRESATFRCPTCQAEFYAANARSIVCPSCFDYGNLEHFSAIVKRAA